MGLDFSEFDLTGDEPGIQELIQRTGRRTVPQIFIDGESIGGYEELAALRTSGALAYRSRLREESLSPPGSVRCDCNGDLDAGRRPAAGVRSPASHGSMATPIASFFTGRVRRRLLVA